MDIDNAMNLPKVSGGTAEKREVPLRPEGSDEISLIEAIAWLGRHSRPISTGAFLGGSLFALFALLSPVTYTATATFMPFEGSSAESGLGGDATQGGRLLALLGGRADNSSFYADLTRSRAVLRQVAEAEYSFRTDDGELRSGTLVELLAGEAPPEEAEKRIVRALGDMIETEVQGSRVIALEVTAQAPALAEQIGREVIRAVDDWNRVRRQSHATIERDFVAESVEGARAELLTAEGDLEAWLKRNVRFAGSPEKIFEYDRLRRRVELKQAVYQSLAQMFEQVRINAVRNTPAIAVLDAPESKLEANSRGILVRGVMGLVVGAGLGVFLAFASDLVGPVSGWRGIAGRWRSSTRGGE